MKVAMIPHAAHFGKGEESGIRRVVEAYFKYLPQYDIDLVDVGEPYELKVAHAGVVPDCDICQCHGLYWTADYHAAAWEWKANQSVVKSIRSAWITAILFGFPLSIRGSFFLSRKTDLLFDDMDRI